MEKEIVLFLQTPRAGEWNYRFIVPEGVSWNDTFLGKCLENLELQKSGHKFSREVTQLGGRTGNEILAVWFENFGLLPESQRQTIHNILEQWFNSERNELILRINWPEEGTVQVVPRPEFTELYNKIRPCFAGIEGSEPAQEISAQKHVQNSFWRKKVLLEVMGMVCLLAGLLCFCSTDLRDYVKNWMWPEVEDKTWEECKPLFQWSTEKPFNKENLKAAFDDTWRLAGRNTEDTVKKYLDQPEIQDLLKTKGTPFPLLILGKVPADGASQLTEKEKQGMSELKNAGTDVTAFRQAVRALDFLQKNREKFEEGSLMQKGLPKEPIKYPLADMNPAPLFFIFIETPQMSYSDLKYVELLKKFYSNTNRSVVGTNNKTFSQLIKEAQEDCSNFERSYPEFKKEIREVFQYKEPLNEKERPVK